MAFNYTGQLMVGVTDHCHVTLYRITVHPLPKTTASSSKKPPHGAGPDGVERIFAKARAQSSARFAAAASSASASSAPASEEAASFPSSGSSAEASSPEEVELIVLDDD